MSVVITIFATLFAMLLFWEVRAMIDSFRGRAPRTDRSLP